jgi:hypothetical protein
MSGAHLVAQKHKIEDFLTPNIVQNFIFNYIDQKMKTEKKKLNMDVAKY